MTILLALIGLHLLVILAGRKPTKMGILRYPVIFLTLVLVAVVLYVLFTIENPAVNI